MRRLSLIVFMLIWALATATRATVRHINVREGLSSRQVYEVAEDPDGFIWVYTNSGIDRYDGRLMKHYTLDPYEEQNDHIQSATSMKTAPDGTLWTVVKSGAIYRYDRERDKFVKDFRFNDSMVLLYNFTVLDDGTLAVCANNGLYRCGPGNGIEKLALDGKFVTSVEPDGHGALYAGTDHGVYRLEPRGSGYRCTFVRGTEDIYVKSLVMASGKLFIGSFSQGIAVLHGDGTLRRTPFEIPAMPVNAMTRIGGDSILIGVDGAGVYLVNSVTCGLLRHYRDGDGSEDELSGNTVTDVQVDRCHGIWIATSHNGLNYIPPSGHSVNVLKAKSGNPNSLVSDYVNVVYEDRDGDLWFGTDKGVSRYNPKQRRWWRYLQRNDYVASVVLSVGQDSRGRILVGTYGDGMSIIDKASGKVERLPAQIKGGDTGLGTEYLLTSYGMTDGDVWAGGINGPLTRYNINTGTYRYYDEDCIATIVPDASGQALFGGNKGVGRFVPHSDSFEWTQQFDTVRIGFPVRAMLADTLRNTLWVGTQGDGLVRYDRLKKKARRFTTADGLSSNTIYSVIMDRLGQVWVCTETDLYRIGPDDERLMRFTNFLGTNRGVFNAGGAICTADGSVMLGTAEGCIFFNPLRDFKSSISGKILFTDFKIHDRRVDPDQEGSPLSRNINLTDRIELSHSQNSFELTVAFINHTSPQRIGFEYRLNGVDDGFVQGGADNRIRYSDISRGKYTLTVRVIDMYSGKPVAERSLEIDIRPPFWLSPWAVALYILISAGLLVFVISFISHARREHRIESQLQSYAALAHDIRTPMSMIKAPLMNVEMESGISESARANIGRARTGIDKTIGMLDEMLGLKREVGRGSTLQVRSVKILEFLQVKIEEFSTLAIFKGIKLECHVDPMLKTVMVDVDKFDHIVDNLMSNALKYTNEGTITVTARPKGRRHWQFAVADTGIGISKTDARYMFRARHRSASATGCDSAGLGIGLLITGRIVADHRGSISFESEEGKGSVFTVTLPMKYSSKYVADNANVPGIEAGSGDRSVVSGDRDTNANTIFIIEDDSDMLAYLKEQLGHEYNIIATDNSATAIDEIREKNPDLVISDVMMPRLRGDELCRMLKTNVETSHIPVILLTGLAGREDIIAGLEALADDYIVKPFDIVVLKARIRNIIKTRRELSKRVLAEDCEPSQEEFASELDREFMTKTMKAVTDNISDSEYSVNELCNDLGMSRTSVYNKIKSITGQSPNEFMRIMKLNRAKELLATRRYNISEVAYMVGFSDPKYFSTCFKKQFGFSPSKV